MKRHIPYGPAGEHTMGDVMTRRWLMVAGLAAMGAFFALSVVDLQCPGLGYDEVMWANVALGGLDDSWISWKVGKFPILLGLPYIGALKGYLYYPLLKLFGASVTLVRLPMVLGATATIGLSYAVARRLLSPLASVVFLVLFALHPEMVMRTRLDYGPAALDLVLRVLALFFLVRYTEGFRRRDAVGFWVVSLLGLWGKLTFIWYINAFLGCFGVYFGRAWWRHQAQRGAGRAWAAVGLHAGLYAVSVAWFVWVYKTFQIVAVNSALGSGYGIPTDVRLNNWVHRAAEFIEGLESLITFTEPWSPVGNTAFLVVSLLALAVGTLSLLRHLPSVFRAGEGSADGLQRLRGLVLASGLLITLQMVATPPADKSWHRMTMFPHLPLLTALGLQLLAEAVARLRRGTPAQARALGAGVLAVTGVAAAAYDGQLLRHEVPTRCATARHQRGFERANVTTVVHQLLDAVVKSDRRFVFLDWGMRNQALLFSHDAARMVGWEHALAQLKPDTEQGQQFIAWHLQPGSRDLFVLHGVDATCFPEGRPALFALAQAAGVTLRLERELRDDQAVMFELWEVAPPVASDSQPR